ncbi:MAG TPA: FAD-dependent monooxygenase [Myxococcaceae bacterium]|jgi:2-polyprenyl-6-methoxyphenol hydroxylase-like FAD-dependent oxidoreductase
MIPGAVSGERILILGGGIGGLALALALARRGVDFLVVEQAPVLRPIGAGIGLSAGAVLILGALGVELAQVGREVERFNLGTADGALLQETRLDEVRQRVGPSYVLHRGELHEQLLAPLDRSRLRLGTTLAAFEQRDGAVDVQLSDGSRERFAVLVGADGLRSQVRRMLWPQVTPIYSGYTCWRAVVHAEPPDQTWELWGRGRRLGLAPLTRGRVYFFATLNAPAGVPHQREGGADRLRALYADFAPGRAALQVLRDEDVIHGDIEEVRAPRWTQGAVALLGDAAHASTPNMGLGATLAIEDAWTLAEEIAARSPRPEALASYERRRFARARAIQRTSWRIGRVAQWEHPLACAARDWLMRRLPVDNAAHSSLQTTLADPAVRALAAARNQNGWSSGLLSS